jgi:hypothetical protein
MKGTRMKTNVGTFDRSIRIILGLTLVILYAIGVIGAWGLIGLIPLATGMLGFCPLYRVLGIRTCRTSSPL